jgi:hypothetical protein
MPDLELSRRKSLQAAVADTTVLAVQPCGDARAASRRLSLPAALGGEPVRKASFPRWPVFREADEPAVLSVLRSGVWSRASVVDEAERRFAQLMGAERCLATCNGTNALITSCPSQAKDMPCSAASAAWRSTRRPSCSRR